MERNLLTSMTLTAVTAVALAFGINVGTAEATTRYCTNDAIIYCGALSPAEFRDKVAANKPSDLQGIYNYFGLTPQEYAKFGAEAKMGTAYKDGRIVVDGRVVATDAWSIGRTGGKSYNRNLVINGKTYYASNNRDIFRSDSIPTMVLFNDKGVMQFAAMTACGNAITGNKVTPTYRCDLLSKTPVAGKANTYQFNTKASAAMGATVKSVTYNFGDGSAPVTMTNLSSAVTHTYAKPGNYTAKVTVNVALPGNKAVTVTSATCATPVTVPQPEQPKETPKETPKTPETPKETPKQPEVCAIDHNLPANSPDCAKCEYNEDLLKSSDQCAAPVTELPKTGVGSTLGLFAAFSVAGAAAYRFMVSRRLSREG